MKILVFDDSPVHRRAAELTLKGHDLTVVGTYDDAQGALVSEVDYDMALQIRQDKLAKAGFSADFNPQDKGVSEDDKTKFWEIHEEAGRAATKHPNFDVVLTDLLVPASEQAQGPDGIHLVGQEMPLGTAIALLALTAGITKVAVVTDMDHHSHPASASFDCFSQNGRTGKLLGVSIICTNYVGMVHIDEGTSELVDPKFLRDDQGRNTVEGLKKYPFVYPDNWGPRKGLLGGKDWGSILKRLLGEEVTG